MRNAELKIESSELQTRPLCCRYLAFLFIVMPTTIRQQRPSLYASTLLGLGLHAEGQREFLGLWRGAAIRACDWRAIFENIELRGVQKVRFAVSSEPMRVSPALHAAFPEATALPSIRQIVRNSFAHSSARDVASIADGIAALRSAGTSLAAQAALSEIAASACGPKAPSMLADLRGAVDQLGPFYALTPRLRRLILAGEESVHNLSRVVDRAATRHGAFASTAEAASFVAEVLARAERRLCGDESDLQTRAARRPAGTCSVPVNSAASC